MSRTPMWGLLGSTAFSVTGNSIVGVAIPLLVLERTGSAVLAGVAGAAAIVPLVLSSLVGGALVDRLGRRRSSVVADLLSALAVAALPLLDATVGLGFGALLALVALGAVFDGPGMAARESLRPDVARTAGVPLDKVNSWGEAIDGFGAAAGPGIAGVLIFTVGPMATLWATVLMFGAASLLTFLVVPSQQSALPEHEPYWRSVWSGLRMVWGQSVLRATALTAMVILLFVAPLQAVVIPALMYSTGRPGDAGLVLTAFAVGGIVGALGYGAVATRVKRRTVLLGALLMCSVGMASFALLPPLAGLLALAVFTGIAIGPINPITAVIMQERTPEAFRGRVIGSITSLALAASPLGVLAAGPIVEYSGPGMAFLVIGLGCLAATAYAALTPGFRDIEPRALESDPTPVRVAP